MNIRLNRTLFLQTVGLAALLVCAAPMPVLAQNTDLNARVQRIENEIATLSRAVFRGETPPAGTFSGNDTLNADIQNHLTRLQMDMQELTGKLEEQNHQISRLRDLENRLDALEQGRMQQSGAGYNNAGAYTTGHSDYTGQGNTGIERPAGPVIPPMPENNPYAYPTRAPKESAALDEEYRLDSAPAPHTQTTGQLGTIRETVNQTGEVVALPATPEDIYDSSYAMLQNQDYSGAQRAFEKFISDYPDHSLTPNAMYWLGETFYVRNQFDAATRVFAESYQKYPKGNKAPDNLLKLAMSLNGQGKPKDACIALGQLKKEYPAGAAPVLTRAEQEIERLKCNSM